MAIQNPKSKIQNPSSPIFRPAIMLTLFFIVVLGFVFPAIIWAISQAVFPFQANGSLIKDAKGNVIGSAIIGQNFSKPEYFHPRPSAAGNGYDASNSSGTNLGPTSDKLINGVHKKLPDGKDDPNNFDGIDDLAKAYRAENGLAADAEVPADAVTRSASGLDPDISVANANIQAVRVAKARGMTVDAVKQLIAENTSDRFLGLYGEPRVNVLQLNLALDKAKP
ncbi:MAG TPA: K(+)-transporting ATPase subunit C [Fimbriimonadaceae bacterium]|nr:K(+)-transporting ATPase subunit C [Fimbriimonadaceae bacterium]